jgi:lipopolysaccharide transport system permease protein
MIKLHSKRLPITVIEPEKKSFLGFFVNVWRYRHFLFYFSIYAMKYRYKQTILGWFWSVIRALFPLLVFNVIFGKLADIDNTIGVPYFLFLLIGTTLWNFLSRSLLEITLSLSRLRKISSKLDFPGVIILIASISPGFVEMISYLVLLIASIIFFFVTEGKLYIHPRLELFFSLFFIALTSILVLGIGFFTSVLNSRARDVRYSLPYIVQFWFYATPVIYPLSYIKSHWKWLISLNPMTVIVEGFRWSLLGTGELNMTHLVICTLAISFLFIVGLNFFNNADLEPQNHLAALDSLEEIDE